MSNKIKIKNPLAAIERAKKIKAIKQFSCITVSAPAFFNVGNNRQANGAKWKFESKQGDNYC